MDGKPLPPPISPYRPLLTILGLAFVLEMLSMPLAQQIRMGSLPLFLLDALWLILAMSPILYFYLYKPLKRQSDNLQQLTNRLEKNESRCGHLVEGLQNDYFFYSHDTKGRFTYLSPSITNILGYSVTEYDLIYNKIINRRPIQERTREMVQTSYIIEVTNRQGNPVTLEISEIPVRDSNGQVTAFEGIAHNITARAQLEQKLHKLIIMDGLTGLYSRRGFFTLARQQIKTAERANRPLALVYLDLDNLKWINDNLGHDIGDQALIAFAHILKQTFRQSDIISRLGGDEFAVLLTSGEDATLETPLLKRLDSMIQRHNAQVTTLYQLSVSIGLACQESGVPAQLTELLTRADALMYEDKRTKKQQHMAAYAQRSGMLEKKRRAN